MLKFAHLKSRIQYSEHDFNAFLNKTEACFEKLLPDLKPFLSLLEQMKLIQLFFDKNTPN